MQFELTNFQAYPKAKLSFAEKVTIIHGETNAGKSSIIRALKQFFCNRPSGDDYRRDFTDVTTIKGLIDNVEVIKKRTKSQNSYQIKKEKFKALRTTVPDRISSLFNIGEENIQSQEDFYFLIDESSGNVARSLNVISDLSITDKSMKNLKSKIRNIKSDSNDLDKGIKKTKSKIKNLSWVNNAGIDFQNILKTSEKQNKYIEQYNQLTSILHALDKHDKKLKIFPVKMGKQINQLDKIFKKEHSLKKEKEALKKLLNSLSEAEKVISIYSDTDFKLIHEIEEIFKIENELKQEKERIKLVLDNLNKQEEKVQKSLSVKNEAERKFKSIKTCPTCNQLIKRN